MKILLNRRMNRKLLPARKAVLLKGAVRADRKFNSGFNIKDFIYIKTLYYIYKKISRHCMLNASYYLLNLPRYQREVMKILNISFPRMGIKPTTYRTYCGTHPTPPLLWQIKTKRRLICIFTSYSTFQIPTKYPKPIFHASY